jgi:nitric oxide reductase subunit B
MVPEVRWSDRASKLSFWCCNLGLAWMVFATLFPLGMLQLYHSVSVGYFDARSLKFLSDQTNAVLEWLRLPGDIVFIVGGALPVVYLSWLGVRFAKPRAAVEAPGEVLFTEILQSK